MATEDFFQGSRTVLVPPLPGCLIHSLHRVLLNLTQETRMIGDLHAVAYVVGGSTRRAAVLSSLRAILDPHVRAIESSHPWGRDCRPRRTWLEPAATDPDRVGPCVQFDSRTPSWSSTRWMTPTRRGRSTPRTSWTWRAEGVLKLPPLAKYLADLADLAACGETPHPRT